LNHPLAHFRIFLADTLNRSVPVHIAGDELSARVHGRGYHRNAGHFALDRFQVVNRQSVRARISGAAAHTADVLGACCYKQKVRANAVDLRLNRRLRTLADADHRNYGGHADNDAEHGERCAHLVALQSAEGHSNDI
jgi:hypothetical protein